MLPRTDRRRGGGTSGGPSRAEQETTQTLTEQRNDELVVSLGEKVGLLREHALNTGNILRDEQKTRDDFQAGLESASQLFKQTMKRMEQLLNTGGYKHMCILALFIVVFFFLLYFVLRGRI
eukprot:GABV01004524.1.p1 GENE.GABV01004524.1~~GABV01004524.1.p1  ORF type:complete len:121 (-),score=20.25 GABV01004524.1:34-396(-)